jgi:hypothetical protein
MLHGTFDVVFAFGLWTSLGHFAIAFHHYGCSYLSSTMHRRLSYEKFHEAA